MSGAVVAVLAAALVGAAAPQAAASTVTATVDPAEPLFGDSFAYVVEAAVPAAGADGVQVIADIGPFTRVAPTREARWVASGVARITLTETLACLTARCAPGAEGKTVVLPAARVTGAASAAAPAQVRIRPRVTRAAVTASKPIFRRPVTLPSATVRLQPRPAQVVIAVVGIVLVAVGLLLFALPVRRRRRSAARCVRDTDSVERAVRLLRESTTRDSTDRRRAAGLAARIADEPELSVEAAHVAWSRAEPAPPAAATLADRLEAVAEPKTARPT